MLAGPGTLSGFIFSLGAQTMVSPSQDVDLRFIKLMVSTFSFSSTCWPRNILFSYFTFPSITYFSLIKRTFVSGPASIISELHLVSLITKLIVHSLALEALAGDHTLRNYYHTRRLDSSTYLRPSIVLGDEVDPAGL